MWKRNGNANSPKISGLSNVICDNGERMKFTVNLQRRIGIMMQMKKTFFHNTSNKCLNGDKGATFSTAYVFLRGDN